MNLNELGITAFQTVWFTSGSHSASHELDLLFGPFHEAVDHDRPGALLVVVRHRLVDQMHEIVEQHPGVPRDRLLVKGLQVFEPQVQVLKLFAQQYLPVLDRDLQVDALLAGVLGVLEREIVQLLHLILILRNLLLQTGQTAGQGGHAVHGHLDQTADELILRELALHLSFALIGQNQNAHVFRAEVQIVQKPNHAV